MKRACIAMAALMIILVNIGCDQGTKVYARNNFKGRAPIEVVDSFFIIRYAENSGGFLSLGSDIPQPYKTILLLVFPCVALAAAAAYLVISNKFSRAEIFFISSVIGGGISNMYDRIVYDGLVTDFMNFGLGPVRTGILNFADLSITFGVLALLAVHFMKAGKEKRGVAR